MKEVTLNDYISVITELYSSSQPQEFEEKLKESKELRQLELSIK